MTQWRGVGQVLEPVLDAIVPNVYVRWQEGRAVLNEVGREGARPACGKSPDAEPGDGSEDRGVRRERQAVRREALRGRGEIRPGADVGLGADRSRRARGERP